MAIEKTPLACPPKIPTLKHLPRSTRAEAKSRYGLPFPHLFSPKLSALKHQSKFHPAPEAAKSEFAKGIPRSSEAERRATE